ncbi:MAG: PAS domain S-box protein, partial [Candidatus Auribacterota bacterium]|nr:PAS domain S-box protein [Candidatus Auribacterota bacterium]
MKTQNSEARDKLRILIVDDIAGQRETLADFLREKGYDPVPAPDGASAVESVKAGPFAAAILDIKLPDTSGEKLAGRLKELNPDLEIILITGYASVETAIGAVRAGVSAYLTKPLDMDLLLADLERALEHRRLILENRQLLEKLRESEARFREMAELMPETIYELDEKGKIVFTNKKGRDNFGYTAEELETDLTAPQMFIPEDRERAKKNMGKVLGGEEVRDAEYAALRKDGSVFPVLTYSLPIRRGNRIAGVRGVMVDITNRKRMEEDLLKLQKLESVGILAGGIAHDFNNILTTILGNISFIRNSLDPESEEHEALSAAEEGCREGRNLTHQLLTFSRGGEPVKETIVIANLLRSGVSFVLRGSNVRPSFQLASDLRPVEADPGQIHQALSNIIINADHAMPDGGTITVKAENVTVTPEDHLPLEKGGYILISIKDTGIGIQKKHLAKIFDPYFTTKPKGSG